MNTTTTASAGFSGSKNTGGFGYGIVVVSVKILFLITTITLACSSSSQTPPPTHPPQARMNSGDEDGDNCVVVDVGGLDESTQLSDSKLLYSQAKKLPNKLDSSTAATCCSICLADYEGSDTLRLLPDCGHLFHLMCVDPWQRFHPTCPVCRRASPVPTPLSIPLARVVPLASGRQGS